ncbi:hypothetical protein ABVG11_02400 [Streptomyces sp. HD1123-B1]|uniref:NADase-type glycan-binding domain-containing protein n=1 Tax=Streptomyces huangiella TaxID=3228804 RepID=UPI003D7D8FC4
MSDDDPEQTISIPLPLPPPPAPAPARARDAALVAPVAPRRPADDEPDDEDVDEVLPQTPPHRRRQRDRRTPRTNPLRPGDLICGDCGQGNRPTRRFCARCGTDLDEAEVVRLPWWRRLRFRRGPRVVPLGTGSGQASGDTAPNDRWRTAFDKIKIVGGLLFCLSCVVYASYPPYRNAVNSEVQGVRDKAKGFLESRYSPVRPEKATSKTSVKGHGADKLLDQYSNSYWLAPFEAEGQDAQRATAKLEFDRLVSLDQLIVTSGAADAPTEHGRPRILLLTFTNGKTSVITLEDTAKPQKFSLKGATGIKGIKVSVGDTFPSKKNDDVAIAELEWFSLLS